MMRMKTTMNLKSSRVKPRKATVIKHNEVENKKKRHLKQKSSEVKPSHQKLPETTNKA